MGELQFELIKKGLMLVVNSRGRGLKFITENKF